MRLGIIGVSGAVGQQMLECLVEQDIVVDELRVFASEKSRGKKILFNNQEYTIQVADESSFDGLDYVLGAVSNELSKKYWPWIKKSGAIYIDNSSAFRGDKDVPLVVPEINGEDALDNHGLIANPNCSTIITLMAIAPLLKLGDFNSMIATTFQAVSGAGNKGIEELNNELNNCNYQPKVFPYTIASNVISEIGSYLDNDYTSEEMKMMNEGRKILHHPDLRVSCTCVRVPVMRSHSISVRVVMDRIVDLDEGKRVINDFDGVEYRDELVTPLDASNQDIVYVSRLRRDLTNPNGLLLWCCGDQIRKGAASNAVGILKYLLDCKHN